MVSDLSANPSGAGWAGLACLDSQAGSDWSGWSDWSDWSGLLWLVWLVWSGLSGERLGSKRSAVFSCSAVFLQNSLFCNAVCFAMQFVCNAVFFAAQFLLQCILLQCSFLSGRFLALGCAPGAAGNDSQISPDLVSSGGHQLSQFGPQMGLLPGLASPDTS